MAVGGEKSYKTFVKGLITEASALTFPENASLDESNFVLNRDGSRSRRLGVDYENGYTLKSSGFTAAQLASGRQEFYSWPAPGGDKNISIGVIRVNDKLWFVDVLTSSPSANYLNGGNSITISGLGSSPVDTAVINNKLVLVSETLPLPVLLTYDKTTKLVSQTTISINVRDIWGVDDGLAVDNRPTTLSNTHRYNLKNQGWSRKVQSTNSTYNSTDVTQPDCIDYTKTVLTYYPSNSDSWSNGKNTNPSDSNYEKYDPNILVKNSVSNWQVAKGSFVIDAFNRGTSRASKSGVSSGLPLDKENGAFSSVASYAQRLFYSGVTSSITSGDTRSPSYTSYIFYTAIVTSDEKLGFCYQEADPTDPRINDLVSSDGGTIQIPEATQIVKISPSKASLLVFAENGVWELYGDTGGFNATSYQVGKVSTNGVKNPKSVVNVNGNFVYWSNAGIYILTPDPVSGRFKAESLSLQTIQTLYLNIPDLAKINCKGFYDEKENRVRWLYNDTDTYSTTNYINKYNRELVLDLTLKAFYTNSISSLATNSPWIADYVNIPGYSVSQLDSTVTSGTDDVIVTDGSTVVITEDVLINRLSLFSFLTFTGTSFTISKYSNSNFVDWQTAGSGTGADYSSYLVTGYELYTDIMRRKQVPYIFFYFIRTEDGFSDVGGTLQIDKPSSCLVQAQWNWTNSAASGKWGTQFQAYRLTRNYIPSGSSDDFDYGEHVIVTKNKLRGSGKSLSLKIQSEAGKDMKILGWAEVATATSKP
jgi:hypothetical protein